MSETWVDAEDYDDIGEGAFDGDDIGEGAYDSEDLSEESRSVRRRRERQRRMLLERQRQARLRHQRQVQLRQQRPSIRQRPIQGSGPSQRQTIAAVRSLDLETKVELDALRRLAEESNRRANRATWAAVAGTAVDQGLDSFSANLTNQYLRAGARFAPLLFLSPQKKKGGVEGFVTDPRFVGGASILSIALLHSLANSVHSALITPAGKVTGNGTFVATAKSRLGISVPNVPFTWKSSKKWLKLDPSSGAFTVKGTHKNKDVEVTATAPNGVTNTITVTVKT
jgi:hypothetical protein